MALFALGRENCMMTKKIDYKRSGVSGEPWSS